MTSHGLCQKCGKVTGFHRSDNNGLRKGGWFCAPTCDAVEVPKDPEPTPVKILINRHQRRLAARRARLAK